MALTVGLVACGSDGGDDSGAYPEATSDAGARGRDLIVSSGCVACHTGDGTKSSGPTWQGLAGSEFTLTDGRTVVADDAYLTMAITNPRAEGRIGFPPVMPDYPGLSAQDVADIVTYLRELPAT